MLARDGVATPITIAHRIRHTLFRPLIPAPWRVQRDAGMPPHCREYLPIVFEPELMGVQPCLHEHTQLFQLALARPKDGQVVHVADIVFAQPALTDEPVHRLQDRVGKTLRCVGPDLYTVFDELGGFAPSNSPIRGVLGGGSRRSRTSTRRC